MRLLPQTADRQSHARVARAEGAQDDGDQHEARHVPPCPHVLPCAPLVEHESLEACAAEVEQAVRRHGARHGAGKGAEGQLQRPRGHRDLLEHVEDAADRRVEDRRHSACSTDRARHPLRVRQALLVDHPRRRAAGAGAAHVHPLLHERLRDRLGDQVGQVATHGDGGPLAADRVAGGIGQRHGCGAHEHVAQREEARRAAPVQPTLVLRRARAGSHRGEDKNDTKAGASGEHG
mmetsp:Transcript_41925/g.130575  ORF Transcript_41925/g.130575 Transcript_41925/m.130575 type:complete len:234 (-) Transcript_41925:350-1051(-)